MAHEVGSGYSGGDAVNSDIYNGMLPTSNVALEDAPSANKSRIKADHVNDLKAEVVGMATRMGAGVYGSQATLKARLERGQTADGDVFGRRATLGFASLDAAVKNGGSSPVAGVVVGEPGHTESLLLAAAGDILNLASNTSLKLPRDFKLDYSKTAVGNGYPILKVSGKSNVEMEGGELDGNAANDGVMTQHDHGVEVSGNSTDVRIKDMRIHDMPGDGVYMDGGENLWVIGCDIEIPWISSSPTFIGRNGVAVVNGEDTLTVKNVFIINCNILGGYAGIDLEPNVAGSIENVFILGCNLVGNGHGRGIAIGSGTSGAYVKKVVVANCIVDNWEYGFTIAHDVEDVCIDNCVVNDCGYGIWMLDTTRVQIKNTRVTNSGLDAIIMTTTNTHVDISNCVLHDNGRAGVLCAGTNGNENSFVSIRGCTIYDNSKINGSYGGIYGTYTDRLVIDGNKLFDTQSPHTQKNGIQIENCDYVKVDNNWSFDHLSAADAIVESGCTEVTYGNNRIGNDVTTGDLRGSDPEFTLSSAAHKFTVETETNAATDSDMFEFVNNRSGAASVGFLVNKPIMQVYQTGVGLALIQCASIRFSGALVNSAAVPANFSADKMITVYDANGTPYYVAAKAASW